MAASTSVKDLNLSPAFSQDKSLIFGATELFANAIDEDPSATATVVSKSILEFHNGGRVITEEAILFGHSSTAVVSPAFSALKNNRFVSTVGDMCSQWRVSRIYQ